MLKGKKTYIVALGGVLAGVGGVLTGELSTFEAILIALNSLGIGTLRAGVKSDIKG